MYLLKARSQDTVGFLVRGPKLVIFFVKQNYYYKFYNLYSRAYKTM